MKGTARARKSTDARLNQLGGLARGFVASSRVLLLEDASDPLGLSWSTVMADVPILTLHVTPVARDRGGTRSWRADSDSSQPFSYSVPLERRGSRREKPVVGVRFVARSDSDQGRF